MLSRRVCGSRLGQHLLAQLAGVFETALEFIHRAVRGMEQLQHLLVILAALLDGAETMAQRADQGNLALAVGEQVVLQIRIAVDYPQVAQHLEQHARRPAGLALATQGFQYPPHLLAEEADDDFPVGKGGVVVGDFAQAGIHGKVAFFKVFILTDSLAERQPDCMSANDRHGIILPAPLLPMS